MSSDGEHESHSTGVAPIALDLRVWSLADVCAWFDCIDDGKYEGRFTHTLHSLDFNGHKLLKAEDETLRLELQIGDAAERKVILSYIAVLHHKTLNRHRRGPRNTLVLDHHDLAFKLINKVFQVIVGVIRNHPLNRAYFWTRWC